ncbi:SGNH/GDSL hydrolase family protein [Virgibacillus ihumii]|uniref:SGNH/GDSL hydrolase family protein n=1 Tax=Virgibacillus ihumii TaxID=2686091 RepID=UPI00157D2FC3|nr:SGNH/GDSL hydrolase family protein [Virgibacillus ihumii]
MKRRYIYIILVILLIGFISLFFMFRENPEEQFNETHEQPQQEEKQQKKDSEQANEPNTKKQEEKKAEEEQEENSVTESLKLILGEALERTVDLFTSKESHIVAIGDSLTQGVGDDVVEGGYVGILKNIMNDGGDKQVTFDNYGVRGNTSSQLYDRLDDPKIKQSLKDADIILITIGANDVMEVVKQNFTNLTLKDFQQERIAYKERLKNILNQMREYNADAEIYLIGFYNPFAKYFPSLEELGVIVESWNSTGKKVVRQYENTTFIPTADLFKGKETDLFASDNFHPNHQGYQLIAKRVLEYITE